jgi:hypothetical protein
MSTVGAGAGGGARDSARDGAGVEPSAGSTDAVQYPQLVRSIEFWMRAYPRRWRAVRGEELLDLVVDLAGPEAQRLGARAAFDLVRGGWATRWREHPPFHTWLLYRLFDSRIPNTYRAWAQDDIDGSFYVLRRNLPIFLGLPVMLVAIRPWPSGIFLSLFFVVNAVFGQGKGPDRLRRDARLEHLMPLAGEPLVEGMLLAWDVPVERPSARSALHWAVLTSGAAVALSVAVAAVKGWSLAMPILLLALVAGVLVAAVARRRLIRLLGECPAQPYRVVRPLSVAGKLSLLSYFSFAAYVAVVDLTVVFSPGLSVLMGAAALILLPGAAAALQVVGRADAGHLAGHDVWLMAVLGRPPTLDLPVPVLRPLPGPVPDGAVVQPRRPADPPHLALS